MGKEGQIDGWQFSESMLNFVRRGPNDRVQNFVLEGPIDVPLMYHTLVGKFPDLSGNDSGLAVVGSKRENVISIYSQILRLELPKRVNDLGIKDNKEMRKACEAACAMGNLPSIVIGIGETRDTEERVIILCSIVGISPKKALLEMQDRIKSRMVNFN